MLNVFPQGLEGTLVVPILVGVLVMAAFTEAFGWEFVGVVVPGYLASVALLAPVVAATVVVEAAVTWAVAVALDRGLVAARLSYPVFGRDRFFLVLAVSVAVRLLLEAFLFQFLVARLGGPEMLARRRELFGVGLVLVPLAANRLWSGGPGRGLSQLLVQAALVVAVLRLVLMPFTNFALSGFDPTYDPLALAFLTSPRPQMALLVTAALASAWNRRFGWDYHGILVPALLGLAVLSPVKLVATAVEATVILLVAQALLRLPRLRHLNVEGARRVVLCFCVGVAFKMIAARTALATLPGYRPTDLLGFGYVLPSLLAERVWQTQRVVSILLPTIQTAVAGFVLTALGAAALAFVAPVPPASPPLYPSLTQAVAALGPRVPGPWTIEAAPSARTVDGYELHSDRHGHGLFATRPDARKVIVGSRHEDVVTAVRTGSALLIGEATTTLPAWSPPPAPVVLGRLDEGWAVVARRPPPVQRPVPAALALASDFAVAIDRARDSAEGLAAAAAPYGVGVSTARDGPLVLSAEGWPTVVLQARATQVVGAAYFTETGTAGAAVHACQRLGADCVIPRGDDGAATVLATVLAQRRGRPLVLVRGTDRPLGADVLVLAAPDPPSEELPGSLRPLADERLRFTTRPDATLATLRAFPAGAGRLGPVALLWLSPFARRVWSGADAQSWNRPDLLALAQARGMTVAHLDASTWLAAGQGAPSTAALDRAELLARTADVALLSPRAAEARLSLIVDEPHQLVAFAVEQGSRRALVVGGTRREERVALDEAALSRARTLLPVKR